MYLNPYLNRVAIKDPRQFFGRRREISKIFSRIGASRPQSISVVGERRIGKSSLLNQIFHPDVRADFLDASVKFVFLFIDLQQRRHIAPEELFQDILTQLAETLDDSAVEGIAPTFDGIRKSLGRLRQSGIHLVILFDEFDAVTTNKRFDLDFYSFLRAIANNYNVAYVTSSNRDLQELCHTEMIADSPFFNIFTNVYLRAFVPAETRQLISEPSATAGVPLEPYYRDIVDIAGHFPFFVQIACASYFDALVEGAGAENRLRPAAEELFIDEARGHFRFIWDHFDDDHRDVIRTLVTGGEIDSQKSHVFEDLKRAGHIIEGTRGPRVFSSLFVDAISRTRPRAGRSDADVPPTDKFTPGDAPALLAAVASSSGGGDLARILSDQGRIGRFVIREKLGGGGMGDVYSAYDTDLTRMVAVKVLGRKFASDVLSKRRFLREAQMASILNHPNIATIYEIGETSGVPYIVMEYVEGDTLSDRLAADGPFPIGEIVAIGSQIASALDEAHDKGVVHRDIKSSNIILTTRGSVKILDFGLAKPSPLGEKMKQQVSDITEPGVLIGTITYMSPEQASGNGEVTQLSDIFSLGVVLYEMTTGKLPFDDETYFKIISRITSDEPTPVAELRPDVPARLVAVINRAMAKCAEDRYPTAKALERDLRAVV
ncbi:MAG TPA: protein kinase [Blastocatellia bacterium]|nr:protein kinase [Blastocatellia bacterium]